MIIRRLGGGESGVGDEVLLSVKNTSGATLSQYVPVFWEVDEQSDLVAVSQASASEQFCLFAGITEASMADDAVGLVKAYGKTKCHISGASAGNEVGLALIPVAGQNYLTDSTSSARHDFNFVNLFETIGAAAGASGVVSYDVFVRAL